MQRAVFLSLFLGISQALWAIPNSVLNFARNEESPLNGQELSEQLLASALWQGEGDLPGNWQVEASVTGTLSSYLMAQPKVFGLETILVRAIHREEALEEIQVTFADAGSFFGYYHPKPPAGLSRSELRDWHRDQLRERRLKFEQHFQKAQGHLTEHLAQMDQRPREISRGRTRALKAKMNEYRHGDLALRLLAAPDRLLRVSISQKGKPPRSWLDAGQEKQASRERVSQLTKAVSKNQRGDVFLPNVAVVPQGYRPYCGLNTLTMVGRYLGLHLDEDWLAVAGKFQNTGSAAGSQMLGLHQAVAKEAGFAMTRTSSYDHTQVRRSLQSGMPVIVWRRWSQARDREHQRVSAQLHRGGETTFKDVSTDDLPNEKSPLHASVIIGFNDKRKEVIFLESWAGQTYPRRMPVREMAATNYLTFCFHP